MGRCPRIEYEGAVYHVLSRGNRQEPIFKDDCDCECYLETLGEACDRCGWRMHAFVLMGNHYHLLLETPHANLVDGMRWLQGTYTKRFNVRHKQWGHLLQGRYRALVVEPGGDYFSTVASYIHLNPARSKGFDLKSGSLSDYGWSSYPLYSSPSKRPDWLEAGRVLGCLGLNDDSSGVAAYRDYLGKRVLEIACSEMPWKVDERWEGVRHGWAFGSERFRESLQERLDGVMDGNMRSSYCGEQVCRHDERDAQRLLGKSLAVLKLDAADLPTLKKGDDRKKVVAWLIRKNTCVKNEWIVSNLHMGRASNLSRYAREVDEATEGHLWDLREMMK